ncbi:MAG TPA: hypothetical protein EYP10_14660 [Armatimonadetes bacterium]|nr:hypothetical protein [Armatimonadota bacterium]
MLKQVRYLMLISIVAFSVFGVRTFTTLAQELNHRKVGVVIVGHGVPPKDFPRDKLQELRSLEARVRSFGGEGKAPGKLVARLKALEREVRQWKRTPQNDPYDAAVKELATHVKKLGNFDIVVVAHNEMCGLDVHEAIEEALRQGARTIIVIPTMLIKGGTHSERDIPAKVEMARQLHPNAKIIYAWPFDTESVARLFVQQINRFLKD